MLYTKLNLSTFHLVINHVNNNQCHFNTSYDNHNSAILFHTAVAEISIYSDEADFLFPGNATTEGYSTEIYPMNLPDIKKKTCIDFSSNEHHKTHLHISSHTVNVSEKIRKIARKTKTNQTLTHFAFSIWNSSWSRLCSITTFSAVSWPSSSHCLARAS